MGRHRILGLFYVDWVEKLEVMNKINLSNITFWDHIGPDRLIDWLQREGYDTVVNDHSSTLIEYGLDDIHDSYQYWLMHKSKLQ